MHIDSAPLDIEDHPRVCGEKLLLNVIPNSIKGSPPRVRGKGTEEIVVVQITGITPACAGKRPTQQRKQSSGRDHPRVCGEKTARPAAFAFL